MRPIRGILGFLLVVTLLVGPATASTSSDKRLIKIGSDITVEKGEKIHGTPPLAWGPTFGPLGVKKSKDGARRGDRQ